MAAQLTINLLPGTDDLTFPNAGSFVRWANGNRATLAELGETRLTAKRANGTFATIARGTRGRWFVESI